MLKDYIISRNLDISIQHVAMYIGGGEVIHAGNFSTGGFVNDVFSSWNKPFITIRRIIY